MNKRVLKIIETTTGDVVHEIDVSEHGPRGIEKIEDGVIRRIDRSRFHTRLVPALPKEKGKVDR